MRQTGIPAIKSPPGGFAQSVYPGDPFSDDGILRHSGIAPCNMSFFSPWEVVRWSDQSLFLCFLSQGIILKLFGLISSLPVNQLVPA
jgi:hypothetical protein